jgi:UDP-GlcNAc:undecaprenyl-phosphate/decaprenyl-phosphate GlcNAc-1-phosphate transferase
VTLITLGLYFGAAFILSAAVTPICRSIAQRLGFVAAPKEDRWHKTPTALFGGVAIVTVTAGLAAASGALTVTLWGLLGCAVLVAAVGLADDILSLKASSKLIAQVVVTSVLLFLGFRLNWMASPTGDAMLTLFWVVGVTNAMNLLDNMDGLCGGVTLLAGAFFLVGVSHQAGMSATAVYLSILLGATAGFLVYNVYPASVFMGDTGSLFLGFNLAALMLLDQPQGYGRSSLLSTVAAPVLLLLIPILDTILVTAARLTSGRLPSQGGRDHSSHRLVAVGLSEPRAVATLWLLAAASGGVWLLWQRPGTGWSIIIPLMFVLGMILFTVYLAGVRVYQENDPAVLRGKATGLVANFMHKRRVAEVLLDLCLIPLAYYTAYRLRFEGVLLAANYPLFLRSLPIVLASQLLALFVVGGYRGAWHHFGLMDAVVFAKGVFFGTTGAELVVLYAYRFRSYSRTVFVIDGALLLLFVLTARGSFRLIGEYIDRQRSLGRRSVVYGTDKVGLATIRHALGDKPLKIIGLVDDDPMSRHMRVDGYPVLGGYETLVRLITDRAIDCVVVNTPSPSAERLRAIDEKCRLANVELLCLKIDLTPVRRLEAVG